MPPRADDRGAFTVARRAGSRGASGALMVQLLGPRRTQAMGWETRTTEHPCPCGQGKRVEIYKHSEWGRSEVDERIECAPCELAYVRVPVSAYLVFRGRSSPGHRLMRREDYERSVAAGKAHEAFKQRLIVEHGPALVRALSSAK